jgi:RNA polymerase sigma-70 factor (ECF subfamily)
MKMPLVLEPETPIVQAAREGVAEAWDKLFRRYQLPLFTYVHELVRDEQTSLDIVQETFIRAVRYLGSLRDDAKFGSWLFGIAHQRCLQHWRRSRHDLLPLEDQAADLADPADDPSEWLLRQEQEARFMNGLSQLSPEHRAVLLLHFLEGFSLLDIAAITGTELGTVKSRLHCAKKALRRRLETET